MVVNAGVESMGGVTDGGVEISSAPSAQQSSYLEKTQAELRDTYTAAEKFRRELEFLQKGGDPLDLQYGNGTSVSLQSTSLFDQHPEQLTSEIKGSFAITASPHGDSVESSGRLGAPSVGEPNSADNLMLFDRENKFHEVEKRSLHLHKNNTVSDVAQDFPKKSYKRRNRSRSNRDGARSSSTDVGPRRGQPFLASRHAPKDAKRVEHDDDSQDQKYLSNSNSIPKSPVAVAHMNLSSNNLLEVKLNGNQTQKSPQPVIQETLGHEEQETVTKGFESKSSVSRSIHSLDDKNENASASVMKNIKSNGTKELNLASNEAPGIEGNDVNILNDDKALNTSNDTSNPCSASRKDNGSTFVEIKDFKESEYALQDESKLSTSAKEHEDSVLEEARIIEEKRKRIAGLSFKKFPSESNHLSHWHFVLEEMSWLANDFAQERLWKVTAAAQLSRRAAYNSQVRFQQQNSILKQKQIAHTLAEAVMDFWHTVQVKCHESEFEGPKKDAKLGLHQYGLRFLEYNSSLAHYSSAQAPRTPERVSDLGTLGISWEDNLTEEDLFYTVPPGAIEEYRKSIESYLLQCERTGGSIEEVDVNGYDAVTAIELQDDTLEEDEGETNPYYIPGAFGGSRSSKPAQKKKKHFRSYGQRSSDTGHGSPFMHSHERAIGPQPSILSGKRPTNSINNSIPTKRVRTASRPRFTGPTGFIQAPNRPDASSGDNNSFQDEHSSLHGGYHLSNNMEVESGGDYDKYVNFDPAEVSNRPKKKKKIKHPGSMFDHQWQLDSDFQNDQKDHLKRRLDTRQFDSNGNSVASQTSNMSNSSKFMKLLVRDRGRKAKLLKTSVGQQGSGSPWSLFEDQALVVLVHDMGANWELISDAINSTLQFKCIYRNSEECKERHKVLMDRNNGDGADSADDSGSSQPYPSTLPGIPEGSARQLFQRLQGPMEEDTLKSHFEKIIMIWQKHHYKKAKKDNHDPKQRQQPHGSHALALSQVCPNNLNGGPVLTPLDLCDAIPPSENLAPVGYQGPHAGGLPGPNNGNQASIGSGSSPASSLPGSSAMGLGSHLASASTPLSPALREGRYGVPRAGSSSKDGQHRIQHLNQMSARNMQQSGLPPGSHSGTDRGIRMLPGGTSMGFMSGMNRNMAMARPAFQGISSPMLNHGVTPGNMHSGPAPGQGSLVRPREALHMMRPNQNSEHQRQIMAPDGTGSFPNQNNTQTPVQSYPHPLSPQQSPHMPHHLQGPPSHPAYGMRFIKERQLHQQRLLQQQFATSNPVTPHVHPQPQQSQIPVSSPQSSTQIQSHASSPLNQMPQHPQKRPVPPPHGMARNPQTGVNLMGNQPPRQPPQPFQPPAKKHHPQHAVKVMNGFAGGQGKGAEQNGQGGVVASKQPTHDTSLNQPQQKRDSGQGQGQSPASSKQKTSRAPSVGSVISSNHRQSHLPQKVASQTQATVGQRMIHGPLENASEPAQTSEPFDDSSGPVSDKAPPQSNYAAGTGGSEHSGPAVNHDEAGVQWQKQPSS